MKGVSGRQRSESERLPSAEGNALHQEKQGKTEMSAKIEPRNSSLMQQTRCVAQRVC